MTMTWVTWVTIAMIAGMAVLGAVQWVRFKVHERRGAEQFARQLDERQPLRALQEMDDEMFWAAMKPAKEKGQRREQR